MIVSSVVFGDFIVSDEGAKSGHAPCRGGNGIRIRVRDPGPRVRDPGPGCVTPHPVVPDPHVVPDPNMVRDPKKCAFEISFRCVTFTLGFIFLDILL